VDERGFCKENGCALAIVDKRRVTWMSAKVMNLIGDVAGQQHVIVDGHIDTAGVVQTARGAARVKAPRKSMRVLRMRGISGGSEWSGIAKSIITEVEWWLRGLRPLREAGKKNKNGGGRSKC